MTMPWERDWSQGQAPWERDWSAAEASPRPEVSGPIQAAAVAGGRALDRFASGLRSITPEPIRNVIDKADAFFGVQPPAIDDKSIANAESAYEPVSKAYPASTFVGDLAARMPVANPVGMGILAATEIGTPAERMTRGVTSYGAGKLGEFVGGKIANALSKRADNVTADLAAQKAQNAVRDTTLKEAQQAGYAIPPVQANPANPGAVNRVLEGISGKIQTAQAAAIKNQEVTNQLAKRALLLPEDAPLTRESIGAVRSAAGEVYKAVKGFGPVAADDEFRSALNGVSGEYRALIADYPSQSNGAINSLLKDLSKDNFNSATLVEFVKRLRHDGFKNIAAIEPERKALGQVQLGAQNALEDLLERRVAATGDTNALDVFRNARALIAKSYTVQNALEESTGKVVAGKIGKEFSKGRPLTGELATIGKTAEAFPKAVQNVNTSMPGLSPIDAAVSTGAAIGSGNPLYAALPIARPIIRAGLLSSPYQKAMVNAPGYAPSLAEKMLATAGKSPDEMQRLGALLGLLGQRLSQ